MTEQQSGRFCIITTQAIEDRRLPPAALRVLLCLSSYSDKDGWCWPGMGTMAKRLGIRRQAVQQQIQPLIDLGYIEAKRRTRDNGSDTSNVYRLLFDRGLFEVQSEPEGVQGQLAPPARPACTQEIERIHRTKKHTVEFEKFWAVHASRRQHSDPKKPAGQKFDAAVNRGVDPETIIRGAENYARIVEREGTDPKYVAQAQTWLSQERWKQYQELAPEPVRNMGPL